MPATLPAAAEVTGGRKDDGDLLWARCAADSVHTYPNIDPEQTQWDTPTRPAAPLLTGRRIVCTPSRTMGAIHPKTKLAPYLPSFHWYQGPPFGIEKRREGPSSFTIMAVLPIRRRHPPPSFCSFAQAVLFSRSVSFHHALAVRSYTQRRLIVRQGTFAYRNTEAEIDMKKRRNRQRTTEIRDLR